RRLAQLGRVLEVLACHGQEVLGLELRVVILPGEQHSQQLPAGQAVHSGCAALRTGRFVCLGLLAHGSPSSFPRRTTPAPKRAWIGATAVSTRCWRARSSGVGAGGAFPRLSWRGGAPRPLPPTPISRTACSPVQI